MRLVVRFPLLPRPAATVRIPSRPVSKHPASERRADENPTISDLEALETLAIIAYLGPVTRPEIARIRGVAADSAVAGLTERGLITEAGREDGAHGGAVKYKTTPMFERVFGLESLSQLPRLDDLPGDVDDLRERLHAVAEQCSA
jgi:segregation and condensation protein B